MSGAVRHGAEMAVHLADDSLGLGQLLQVEGSSRHARHRVGG
jgi:hypothetical protein